MSRSSDASIQSSNKIDCIIVRQASNSHHLLSNLLLKDIRTFEVEVHFNNAYNDVLGVDSGALMDFTEALRMKDSENISNLLTLSFFSFLESFLTMS